jgi:hypothetical protein
MVTKGYQKGVYERVTKGIGGGVTGAPGEKAAFIGLAQHLRLV